MASGGADQPEVERGEVVLGVNFKKKKMEMVVDFWVEMLKLERGMAKLEEMGRGEVVGVVFMEYEW